MFRIRKKGKVMNLFVIAKPQQEFSSPQSSSWRDMVGIFASVGCAIHCAAMPFVIAYLPALGLSFLADEAFHKWMALACFLIAIVAFVPGLIKHGNWVPVSIASFGLTLITVAAFGLSGDCCSACSAEVATESSVVTDLNCCEACCESCGTEAEAETPTETETHTAGDTENAHSTISLLSILSPWITPVGGIFLVAAHLLNRRFGSNCACCEPQPIEKADRGIS
ncbi:MerC domain-containing protein [Pirellulaceae bacterium]|jgi:hypothetical protein|nr:MerC domain-containing protein [Pirellulaceae bacterium]